MFRYLILGLLRHGTAHHGFGLLKEYRDRSGADTSSGNVYREMPGLLKEGLVKKVTNPGDADSRRIPYEITDAGRTAFDAWLSEPGDPLSTGGDNDLSARALFLADATPETVHKVLDQWKDGLLLRTKLIERPRRPAIVDNAADDRGFAALPTLISRRLKHIAADLEFIDDFRSAYDVWLAQKRERGKPRDPDPRPNRRGPPNRPR